MNVSFLSPGFFADNEGEFTNIELDKLTSKLGLSIRFGPGYYYWSNDLNKRNQSSAYLTIKKMMKENKTPLTDSLVKPAP